MQTSTHFNVSMIKVARIKSIYRYPVKSMAGEDLASVQLGWHGLAGDRRYAFVREGNLSGFPWLTASKLPEILRYKATCENDDRDVRVVTPAGTVHEIGGEPLRQELATAFGAEVRLLRVENGIFDDSPISLISTTTLKSIESSSGSRIDDRQLRPNFLIEPIDNSQINEGDWVGRSIAIGDNGNAPSLHVIQHDVRCVMVNLNPDTAESDPRVLQTIARTKNNCAGIYATVMQIGSVSRGDSIYIL